ncbi:MAG: hypothetical protein RIB57_15895 [Pelagibacterium sp.]|uniref:hypothetical protein n=1 Tax=Pelagibacterium sp. TaxID=1967288 RepID=UPI0032F07778
MSDHVLEELRETFEARKRLEGAVGWERSGDGRSLQFVVPLMIDGLIAEGVRLRGLTSTRRPDRDVSFQHEQILGGTTYHVSRLDWRPRAPHTNRGAGPEELRFSPISGSHWHPFQLNAELGVEAVLSMGNLPVALPIDPDPLDFNALKNTLRELFRIGNAQEIGLPPWSPELDFE